MRSHKSFAPEPKKAKKEIGPDPVQVQISSVNERIDVLIQAVGAAMDMGEKAVDIETLKPMLEALQEATKRPTQMGIRVVRNAKGEITGMIGTTKPAEISAIKANRSKRNIN